MKRFFSNTPFNANRNLETLMATTGYYLYTKGFDELLF